MERFEYCNGVTHNVQEGDSLYTISRRYKVPLALIMRANPYVDVYNLQVGDEICIPFEWPNYTPQDRPNQNPGDMGNSNESNSDDRVWMGYVVKDQDTIKRILEQFGVDLEELLKYNGLDAIMLKPGAVLKVPKKVND